MVAQGFYTFSETKRSGVSVETEDVNNDGQIRSTVIVDDSVSGERRIYQYWHENATRQQALDAHRRVVLSVEKGEIDLCAPSSPRPHPSRSA